MDGIGEDTKKKGVGGALALLGCVQGWRPDGRSACAPGWVQGMGGGLVDRFVGRSVRRVVPRVVGRPVELCV